LHAPAVLKYLDEPLGVVINAQVGKRGNSLAVRIPGAYARELGLAEGAELDLTCVDGSLSLRPRKREYRLDELLEQIR
jgi:antitoxin MazE